MREGWSGACWAGRVVAPGVHFQCQPLPFGCGTVFVPAHSKDKATHQGCSSDRKGLSRSVEFKLWLVWGMRRLAELREQVFCWGRKAGLWGWLKIRDFCHGPSSRYLIHLSCRTPWFCRTLGLHECLFPEGGRHMLFVSASPVSPDCLFKDTLETAV